MNKIINIAVIAHVDHGKTTLVDALLKQTKVFRENQEEMGKTQIMDSNELERERGITILAKNCSVHYKDTKINIIDTPGHADFSGEVERTLGMANGALLIVDAQEGPMPQTRFVLKKAIEQNLKIIVVINKIDKKFADPKSSLSKVESLFLELAHSEDQITFTTLYAVGSRGAVYHQVPQNPNENGDVTVLLDTILENIPVSEAVDGPFKMLVSSLDYNNHLGRSLIGKVHSGVIHTGDKVVISESPNVYHKVEKLRVYEGLGLVDVDSVSSGEIVAISGIQSAIIGSTVCDPSDPKPLPSISISEPTIHITMGPNTSPFGGREGKFHTSRQIEERLNRELEKNLSLKINKLEDGRFRISGRGELHLSVLLETMRREGFEMEVSTPEVVIKEIDGEKLEPVEEVSIIVSSEYVGIVSEEFGKRQIKLISMNQLNEREIEFIYHSPTRLLFGVRSLLTTLTKGTIIYNSSPLGFSVVKHETPKRRRGALIASQPGESSAYGLQNAQGRGTLFIGPTINVYEGMIVGINAKHEDITVNVCKGKKLTNMRSKSSDGVIHLTPAVTLSLEQSLDFLEKDELLEITPKSLRLRKKHLTQLDRKRSKADLS